MKDNCSKKNEKYKGHNNYYVTSTGSCHFESL